MNHGYRSAEGDSRLSMSISHTVNSEVSSRAESSHCQQAMHAGWLAALPESKLKFNTFKLTCELATARKFIYIWKKNSPLHERIYVLYEMLY